MDGNQRIRADFDGKRFRSSAGPPLARPAAVLRWMATRKSTPWPRWLDNPPPAALRPCVDAAELRLTFINHATVLIQTQGMNILTDPVFSDRVSPVRFAGPKRHRAAGLALEDLPPVHAVLISHTHYDHLDLRSLQSLCKRHDPEVLVPLKTGRLVEGVCPGRYQELDWWQSHALTPAVTVHMVPALHWTSRKPGDENTSLWGGFVLEFEQGAVYFAGDTGFGDGRLFRQIGQRFPDIRCALLPIGAYEPRWFMQPQHMNPDEAVQAFELLQARHALGIHHGTFKLTDEAHDDPVRHLNVALDATGIDATRFIALQNGQAWDVPA